MSFTASVFYKDPKAAHRFLERAFSFDLSMLVEPPADDPTQMHSEMTFGDGDISVGAEWAEWVKSPKSVGGSITQRLTVHIKEDIDAYCERARRAGGLIVQEPADQPYGARTFVAVDFEGHEWQFSQRQDFSSAALKNAGIKVEQLPGEPSAGTFFAQRFYRGPRKALAWLEKAFGFETTMIIENGDGDVRAHLAFGGDLVALGSEWTDPVSLRPSHRSPRSLGGGNTQALHVQLERDIDGHCERARAGGASIIEEPEDQFYGDRT
jgi:uncharacterized glyoxalase superfamily protein PhnB